MADDPEEAAIRRGYDTRPVYDIAPEDDPGIGGVPGARCPSCGSADRAERRTIGMIDGEPCWDTWHDERGGKVTREELKEIMEASIARAELDGPQLAELYDLSKTELFSKTGGEIVREVIEARQ